MKITKKQRKTLANHNRQLLLQRKKVTDLEDYMINNIDPVECPVEHYFTDNGGGMDIMCRSFEIKKDVVITGTLYKKECFWILGKGSIRIAVGDGYRDIVVGQLIKNNIGTKNSMFAFEDSILYGFVPNPKNSRDLAEIVNAVSSTPYDELLESVNNKQKLQRSLTHEN